MPNPLAAAELPKALQSMIADAKKAIDEWQRGDSGDDPATRSADDWDLRLSRGEFDGRLYWDCAADDCGEVGDWVGAIAAYRMILELPDVIPYYLVRTHRSVGRLQDLLGDGWGALASYRSATAQSAVSKLGLDVPTLRRSCIYNEIAQLLQMGQIRRGRKLVQRCLATLRGKTCDQLGTATILMRLAQCLHFRKSDSG